MTAKGWKRIGLGSVMRLASGSVRPRNMLSTPTSSHNIPVFGGNGIMGYAELATHDGDRILIGRVGEKCGVLHFHSGPCWVTDNALVVEHLDPAISAHFMFLALQFANLPRLRAKGGQPLISQKPIYGLEVVAPTSKSEQARVAAELARWDSAIATMQRLAAAQLRRRQSLLQQLLTGKLRLTGFTGAWNSTNIGKLLSESRIAARSGSADRRITVRLDFGGVEARTLRREDEGATAYFERRAGQFIYGKQNLHFGAVGIVPAELDGFSSSQDVPAFDVDNSRVLPAFLLTSFARPGFCRSLEPLASGTGSKRIHADSLYKIKLLLPALDEQRAISCAIGLADREITLLTRLLAAYRRQRRGLMQQLLTGKRRLPGFGT